MTLYAATLRTLKRRDKQQTLESWYQPMKVLEPLPTLPLWLDIDLAMKLELETSYEDACRMLRIE